VTQISSPDGQLRLPSCLDLSATESLANSFGNVRGLALVVVASDVRTIGAQCIQILLSAVATWRKDHLQIRMIDPSPAILDALRILGIPPSELMIKDDCR